MHLASNLLAVFLIVFAHAEGEASLSDQGNTRFAFDLEM